MLYVVQTDEHTVCNITKEQCIVYPKIAFYKLDISQSVSSNAMVTFRLTLALCEKTQAPPHLDETSPGNIVGVPTQRGPLLKKDKMIATVIIF